MTWRQRAAVPQICNLCDGVINVGDPIARRSRRWCHAACVEREVGE